MKNSIQDLFGSLRLLFSEGETTPNNLFTIYANLDTTNPDNRRERPAWLIEVKNQFDKLATEIDENVLPSNVTLGEIEEHVIGTLNAVEPRGRSVVMFTDLSNEIVVDLPQPTTTRAYYGLPQIKHLLSQLHRYGKYLVVLFSETEHRVISIDITDVVDEHTVDSSVQLGVFLRPGGKKARTQASERRDLDSERRVYREAAHEIQSYFADEPEFDRIIFGGNLRIAHNVKNALHHSISEKLVSIEPIPLDASVDAIRETVQQIAEECNRVNDIAQLQELLTRQETCERAVTGTEAVLEALGNGQVSKILLPYPMDTDDFDALLVEALKANVDVELLHGEAAARLRGLGGIGAILYYSL
ncbi:hypothetical protein [Aliagarivorans marinus]|uniref:baeRF10 domain-containing protein n=1 Tax=Aliagarivorans marinus TaxID=561965 RepID=UPI000414A33B|nr:hypothetical protein [Aliagarivorans marinus]